jgi:hypothetical protein
MASQSPEQLVLELVRSKVSSSLGNFSPKDMYVYLEGLFTDGHRRDRLRSVEMKLHSNAILYLPCWGLEVLDLRLHLLYRKGSSLMTLAEASFNMDFDMIQTNSTTKLEVSTYFTQNEGKTRVGKLLCRLQRKAVLIEEDEEDLAGRADETSIESLEGAQGMQFPPSSFRFRRLGRPVHWDRLKSINLDRASRTADVGTIMSCLGDAMYGDISQEGKNH